MIYSEFKDLKLSRLGFGLMRLPVKEDNSIDVELTKKMVDYAICHGVNYFDTAWPYHGGMSEVVIGNILKDYPRESFYLASKYPGHQILKEYHPEEIFEKQLKKCQVEYFDFYLLHNVYERSIDVYNSDDWNIIDYFIEQKKLGRIRHLGFSTHGNIELIDKFLSEHPNTFEFVQIQLNYLDYTLQQGKEKYELITNKYHLPVWVMEPVRGGKLTKLDFDSVNELNKLNNNYSLARWCFSFLLDLSNTCVILSGMTDFNQMVDNVNTFETFDKLEDNERQTLLNIAEKLKDSIPCTTCKYCVSGCPKNLNIPMLINAYNDMKFHLEGSLMTSIKLEALEEDKKPSSCIKCNKCSYICPQKINVPNVLDMLNELMNKMPKWEDVCEKRQKETSKF